MLNLSEYEVKPRHLIVHNPAVADSLAMVTPETLEKYYYFSVPNKEVVYKEFDSYVALLSKLGAKPIELGDLLSRSQREYMMHQRDPNMMFTRDPVVTLPWDPSVFIKCRFS